MDSKEALASLQLLVLVAKANGVISDEERTGIQDALEGSSLPGEYTVDSLLSENQPLESVLAVIQSETARHQSFSAAYLLAHADGDCSPEEKALLEDLQKRWNIPDSEMVDLHNAVMISQGTMAASIGAPSQTYRSEDAQGIIKVHRILAGIAGAIPIPIIGEVMVLTAQMRMVSEIGKTYGRNLDRASIKALLATVGLGTGARMAVTSLAKLLPGFGSLVGAAGGFIATHAMGQVAVKYFESGGTLSTDTIKSLFKEQKAAGEKEYEANKGTLDANKEIAAKMTELGKQLKTNSITQEQYDVEVAKLNVQV
ncbi:MAG: hypothetical protein FD167_447 [bacterium]|nr:MAG: hypothetical protein FD167_447 [bacterium]